MTLDGKPSRFIGAIAGGVAGNALFALTNTWVQFARGPAWWVGMAAVFVVFGAVTYALVPVGTSKRRIASNLTSGVQGMDLEIHDITVVGGEPVDIGSDNHTDGKMTVKVKGISLP